MTTEQYKQLMEGLEALELAAMRTGLFSAFDADYEEFTKELTRVRRGVYDLLDTIAFGEG